MGDGIVVDDRECTREREGEEGEDKEEMVGVGEGERDGGKEGERDGERDGEREG